MIASLLSRELYYNNFKKLNIAYISSSNSFFEKFIKSLGHSLYTYDNLYVGQSIPDLCITNNQFTHIDMTINICQHHQINLIVIDHEDKSEIINTEKILMKYKAIPNIIYVAINEHIYNSWGRLHHAVLDYSNQEKWNELLYNCANQRYIYE